MKHIIMTSLLLASTQAFSKSITCVLETKTTGLQKIETVKLPSLDTKRTELTLMNLYHEGDRAETRKNLKWKYDDARSELRFVFSSKDAKAYNYEATLVLNTPSASATKTIRGDLRDLLKDGIDLSLSTEATNESITLKCR